MPELTYLFRAIFTDSVYDQSPDDTARLAARGSCFTDVLWVQEHSTERLRIFALCIPTLPGEPESGMQPVAAVHLTDGHFELGGNEFYAGADGLDDPAIERRLIYYRQVRQVREQDVDARTGAALSEWRDSTHIRYVIGWQATINGRNVQHVIALDG